MSRPLHETHWLTSPYGNLLHAAGPRTTPQAVKAINEGEGVWIATACGRRIRACIPGIFTRMGDPRCPACCKHAGLPEGVGSPKNDPACRQLLGLEQAGSPEPNKPASPTSDPNRRASATAGTPTETT